MTEDSWHGRQLQLTIGAIAHGGHCVARHEGRVVFVRHTLPGEVIVAEVTEDHGGSFCRADAITVLQPAPGRVTPPCHHAHPGGCGGCDFQHIDLAEQRRLKADVISEQLLRLAGLSMSIQVQPLSPAGAASGLGWRRRMRYAVTSAGELGLRAHRSHEVIDIKHCPLAAAEVSEPARWRNVAEPGSELEVASGDSPGVAVLAHRERPAAPPRQRARSAHRPTTRREHRMVTTTEQVAGPETLDYHVGRRRFQVAAAGFWQTHPDAAATFTRVVAEQLALRPGERALDLYAGAGLFTAMLADEVTSAGRVIGLEANAVAVADAAINLASYAHAAVKKASVSAATLQTAAAELGGVDAVVLDPPRAGAGRAVMTTILGLEPRVIVYVACDPAALARDLKTALDLGWVVRDLVAFDAFPMTHHVECIATFRLSQA